MNSPGRIFCFSIRLVPANTPPGMSLAPHTTGFSPLLPGARDKSNIEVFYCFPLFPLTDMTLSYREVINPALDPSNDSVSVFSIRFRSTF